MTASDGSPNTNTKLKFHQNPGFFVLIAMVLIFVGGSSLSSRLLQHVDGTVVESVDIPYTGAPRYVTHYVLTDESGNKSFYVAGSTDGSLPRSIPVGHRIQKLRWHITFDDDGRTVYDFPTIYFGLSLVVAAVFLFWSVKLRQ